VKSEIHNPFYAGEFIWNGKTYPGKHTPIVTKETYDRVQQVFVSFNRPRITKRRFAFGGLLTCGIRGCAMTAEIKKQKIHLLSLYRIQGKVRKHSYSRG
jgi:site-specific DNA recombinase